MPALAALNHAVCTVFHRGDTLFLDPTTHYLPLGAMPDALQGREAMVEQGDSCLLLAVPTLPPSASTDSLHYDISIDRQQLNIRAAASWSGSLKELALRSYDQQASPDKGEWRERWLRLGGKGRKAARSEWTMTAADSLQAAAWARLTGTLTDEGAVTTAGGECYVGLHPGGDPICTPIDTAKRVNDAELPFRCRIVREARLALPQGYRVKWLPERFDLTLPQGTLHCSFSQAGGEVVFRKVADISDKHIRHADIAQWNDALRRWNDAANQQIILEEKP